MLFKISYYILMNISYYIFMSIRKSSILKSLIIRIADLYNSSLNHVILQVGQISVWL